MAAAKLKADKNGWIVHGTHKNSPWAILVILALIAAVVVLAYQRFMAFDTITYQVRQCAQPLTAESTWADIEAAGCRVGSTAGMEFRVYEGRSEHVPDSVTDDTFIFDRYPVNSVFHTADLTTTEPGQSALIVDPGNEEIRTVMNSDRSGKNWSAYVGREGPTDYWILLTPGNA